MLLTFLNILATIIGVISLLIVTYGVFVGFIAFLRNEFKRINGTYTINNVRQLRADFGSYLLLGLEFLIASDILKTVVDPTLDELAILRREQTYLPRPLSRKNRLPESLRSGVFSPHLHQSIRR